MSDKPTVAIVLCTYNGAEFLQPQLDSLAAQTWPVAVRLFDDASTDQTIKLAQKNETIIDLAINNSKTNKGYVKNFESGIQSVLQEGFEYIALCDQDDYWHPERVEAGMQKLLHEKTGHSETPLLCHSDLQMIDADNQVVQASYLKYRGYDIGNEKSLATVLGQSGVMGNTILMNKALAQLALPFPPKLHVHDYWLGVIAELYGHRILVDEPLVNYRIHEDNASNSTGSIKFGVSKLTKDKSWQGFIQRDYRLPFKEDTRLHAINELLTPSPERPELSTDQRILLEQFKQYLEFKTSRISLYVNMLKHGFFRKGIRHRIRLAYSTLLTQRYTDKT